VKLTRIYLAGKRLVRLTIVLVPLAISHTAYSKPAAKESALSILADTRPILFQDGFEDPLTPIGAIRSGTADGLVPSWTGGIISPPAGFEPNEHHISPFPDDTAIVTIDASNVAEFEDLMSNGHLAMLANFSGYAIPLYESRRTASYPQHIYAATIENQNTARILDDGRAIEDASIGFPFRKPKNGAEVIWNHLLRYKGIELQRRDDLYTVESTGDISALPIRQQIKIEYQNPQSASAVPLGPMLFEQTLVNASGNNNAALFHETLNSDALQRGSWIYTASDRRVRRAPNVIYDVPLWDPIILIDMLDMFSGPVELFNWELKGRHPVIIPYNAYQLHSGELAPEQVILDKFINPLHTRYELHRVLVVEATLKPGAPHKYPRRVFYLDEDSYQIVLVEHYDETGRLAVFSEAHPINYYQIPLVLPTLEVFYDLANGGYTVRGVDNQLPPAKFSIPDAEECFTPQALRVCGRGIQ
jgi:hypothetical protein